MIRSFNELDDVETSMGLQVEEMTSDQLVAYVRDSMFKTQGIQMSVDGLKERSIFNGMRKTYGPSTTGRIVKWVFYRYQGIYAGEPIRFFSFCKARKWWTDKMDMEMQRHLRTEYVSASTARATARTVEI